VPSTDQRFDRLDALRGVAIVWMAIFHFCFDLNHFGLLRPVQQFPADPFWTLQRTCIVSLFLVCAGAGQAVALSAGQGWPRFWRRWAQVAACALLVSAGSALMFPRSWISFGVLHGLALMLLLARLALVPLLRGRDPANAVVQAVLWAGGALALALPRMWQHPMFNTRWLNWTGLVTRLPFAEDYVPVLPWLGVLLWGVAIGLWVLARRRSWFAGTLPAALRPLAVLGRWALSFYMLHQPVLIGLLMAWTAWHH
jgi:uncharacterized membrane protein